MKLRLQTVLAMLTLLAPGRAPAVTNDVRTLVIEGRVADAEGFPVTKTRVDAGPRATVDVDDNGHYLVSLVVGSVPGLTRTPFHVTLRPWKRGWRVGLPGSHAALVLEVRLGLGPDRRERIEVRSNDRWVAQALADSIADGAGSLLHLTVHFLGEPGTGTAPEPVPDVAAFVPLHELEWPARQTLSQRTALAASGSANGATAVPLPSQAISPSAVQTPQAHGRAPGGAADDGPATGNPATGYATRSPSPRRADAPRGGGNNGGSATRSFHLFPSADDALSGTPAESTHAPRAARDTVRANVQTRPPAPPPMPHAASPLTNAPVSSPVPAPASRTGAPAPPTQPVHAPANAAGQGAAPASRPATTSNTHPGQPAVVPPPAPGPAVSVHVIQQDAGESHSNAVRVWGGRTVPASAAPQGSPDDCGCIVQGVVEVRSDQPTERLRVVVALEEHPALCDTVELFMGSPRPFTLRGLPCGMHRITVHALSRRRFHVTTPEALGTFDCSSGALHHPRIVLAPR